MSVPGSIVFATTRGDGHPVGERLRSDRIPERLPGGQLDGGEEFQPSTLIYIDPPVIVDRVQEVEQNLEIDVPAGLNDQPLAGLPVDPRSLPERECSQQDGDGRR
jgi:hypothetical protein